jgi:hypothetical protein
MPMYRMGCNDCGAEHDVFRTIARIDADLPECCGATMHRRICAPTVVADIAPYQAMGVDVATGRAPVIGSRSAHRDYLKRNGYIEVGNEQPKLRTEVHGDFDNRAELRQAVREVLPKYTR